MKKNIAISRTLEDLKDAHTYIEQTMDGVTAEVAAFMPPGKANPIAGLYAHLVFSEDFFTHFFLKDTKPLFESSWKDKTGISDPQPTEWQEAYPKWLKTVKIDVAQAREYAKHVFKETEEYIASLTDEDLEKSVDMSMFGMGTRTVGSMVGGMIIGHTRDIMGEISAIKGVQGLKGYPF